MPQNSNDNAAEYTSNPILNVGGLISGDINVVGALARLKTFVFALSGALTFGRYKVEGVYPEENAKSDAKEAKGMSEDELLELAAHAEYFSSHEIAKAIIEEYEKRGHKIDLDKLGSFKETMHHGVFAEVDGKQVVVGNLNHMYDYRVEFTQSEREEIRTLTDIASLFTTIYVAVNDTFAGRLDLIDGFRPEAKRTIEDLHKAGCKTYLLTGNSKSVAEAVVRALAMDGYKAGLEPDDKMQAFMDYKRSGPEGSTIAFVGDGDNDIPYLGLAEVGIAVKK